LQKAAILLVVLGEEAASHIYRNLPETDVQRLTRRIAELERFKPETAIAVLEEYHQLTVTQGYLADGGPEYAQKLLVKAFGEPTAKRLLEQVANTIDQHAVHLESLQEADPQQLAKFLEVEHPQTIALILAHLMPGRLPRCCCVCRRKCARYREASGAVAPVFPGSRREGCGRAEQAPGVARRAEPARLCRAQRAAELLNQIEPIKSKSILENIEKDDPKMALGIRNLMFTFETCWSARSRDSRAAGTAGQESSGARAARASEELKNLVFKSMSSRAVDMLKEDMEVLGAVRPRT